MPQNIKKDISLELEKMKKMSTFSEAKEFKKRDWKKVIPPIAAEPWIIDAFNREALNKKWSKTTLMNEILKERYGKENSNYEND